MHEFFGLCLESAYFYVYSFKQQLQTYLRCDVLCRFFVFWNLDILFHAVFMSVFSFLKFRRIFGGHFYVYIQGIDF